MTRPSKIVKSISQKLEVAFDSCPQCQSKDISFYEPMGGKPGYEWWMCRECGHKFPVKSQNEAFDTPASLDAKWAQYWLSTNEETRTHLLGLAASSKLGWPIRRWGQYPWQQIPEEVRGLIMRHRSDYGTSLKRDHGPRTTQRPINPDEWR